MNKSPFALAACLAFLTVAFAGPTEARAQVTQMVGAWTIQDSGPTCSMQARTRDNTGIEMAVPKGDPTKAQLRLAHADWRSLTQRPKVRISVLVDGQPQLLRPVETFAPQGAGGLSIPFGKNYATKLIREGATLSIIYEGNVLLILHLYDADT